jgi:hypothetical protein
MHLHRTRRSRSRQAPGVRSTQVIIPRARHAVTVSDPTHPGSVSDPTNPGSVSDPTNPGLDAAVQDRHIASFDPLPRPIELREEYPADPQRYHTVTRGRADIEAALRGEDDRMVVVVGPCSIHDRDLAHEYASRLGDVAATHRGELIVVMRTYFEKPRTSIGWKGLIYDPSLDGSSDAARGLRTARQVLLDVPGDGPAVRGRGARHDHAAVLLGPGVVGGDRSAHGGEPGAPSAGFGPVDARGVQERHGWPDRRRHQRPLRSDRPTRVLRGRQRW